MRLAAAHAELFDCKQFVTWSGSYSDFGGADPRNHTAEAVAHVRRAIREIILPIIQPIGGRAALEPYYPHIGAPVSSPFSTARSARAWSKANLYEATNRPSASNRWMFRRNCTCSSGVGGGHVIASPILGLLGLDPTHTAPRIGRVTLSPWDDMNVGV